MSGKTKKAAGRSSALLLVIGIFLLAAVWIYRLSPLGKPGRTEILTSAVLKEATDISELSTAEFRYKGIAEEYEDEAQEKIKCHISYSAVVKAGIDMEDVEFMVDSGTKTVTAFLPPVRITTGIVNSDSMSLIPSKADISLADMIACCEEDAKKEALSSDDLLKTAEENLRASVEGLLYPILKNEGYVLVWDGVTESGAEQLSSAEQPGGSGRVSGAQGSFESRGTL